MNDKLSTPIKISKQFNHTLKKNYIEKQNQTPNLRKHVLHRTLAFPKRKTQSTQNPKKQPKFKISKKKPKKNKRRNEGTNYVYIRKTRESESLKKLASNSTGTNHENFCILKNQNKQKTQNDVRKIQNDDESEETIRLVTLITEEDAEAIESEGLGVQ